MSVNRPESVEGVVLRDVIEVVKAAEKKFGPWPELEEPRLTSGDRSSFAQRVTVWTMAGLLGAITVYAITTGDQRVLLVLVVIAASALLRLAGLMPKRPTSEKRTYDPRSKRRKRKRNKPS